MKVGSLVEMYGEPGFYGIIVRKSEVVGRWYVLWQSGSVSYTHLTLPTTLNV